MATDRLTTDTIQTLSAHFLRSGHARRTVGVEAGGCCEALCTQLRIEAVTVSRGLHAMCLPSAAEYYTSLLYLSLAGCRAVSHKGRLGPHGATSGLVFQPRIVAVQGRVPNELVVFQGTVQGGSRFGIAVRPLRQDTFLGFAERSPWIALFRSLSR